MGDSFQYLLKNVYSSFTTQVVHVYQKNFLIKKYIITIFSCLKLAHINYYKEVRQIAIYTLFDLCDSEDETKMPEISRNFHFIL